MKYGVIVYKKTKNIGDDIQSYAAAQLLPQVDYYIEREHLDVFRSNEQEAVNVIVNGWMMYNKLGWPISPCINPLYLSMHFWENDALGVNDLFLQGLGSEDLRKHEPVGCRDKETQQFLEKAGIKTWLSGCVTLTLTAKYPRNNDKYICLVDVPDSVETYIKNRYPGIKIHKVYHEGEKVVLQENTWQERFINVEKYLEIYQNAQAVITSRLHCALPCLGLETPVLLLLDDDIAEQGRFDGLEDLVLHGSVEKFINGNVQFDLENPPQNLKKYHTYRDRIFQEVELFIKNSSLHREKLKERYEKYDSEWEKRALWKDEQITRLMHSAIIQWNERHNNLEELQKGKNWLEEQYYNFKNDNSRLISAQQKIQAENQELLDKNVRLQITNSNLKTQVKEKILQNDELNNQIFLLENSNADLKIRHNILNQKIAELQEKKDELNTCNSFLVRQNEKYYQSIEELKNSISWKIGWVITAIPRKIVKLLKKF